MSNSTHKEDPIYCPECSGTDIQNRTYEDKAICSNCGYEFLGLGRNPRYAREWTADDTDHGELWRDAEIDAEYIIEGTFNDRVTRAYSENAAILICERYESAYPESAPYQIRKIPKNEPYDKENSIIWNTKDGWLTDR